MSKDLVGFLQDNPHSVIITATQRLQRELQKRFSECQIEQGVNSWETPQIVPWSAWRRLTWQRFRDQADLSKVLLSDMQTVVVWQRIIEHDIKTKFPTEAPLWDIYGTAYSAMQAWRLAQDWNLDLQNNNNYLNNDQKIFLHWAGEFEKCCEQHHWIDEAKAGWEICQHLDRLNFANVPYVFAGFDCYTHQQSTIIGYFKSNDVEVHADFAELAEKKQFEGKSFATSEAEIFAAASLARKVVEQNPSMCFGFVLPDLDKRRATVDNLFRQVMNPNACLSQPTNGNTSYHISQGQRLCDTAVINDALLLLDLVQHDLNYQQITNLLSSPFLRGSESELSERSAFDARLRRRGFEELNVRQLLLELDYGESSANPNQCGVLKEILTKACTEYEAIPEKLTPGEWVEWMTNWLDVFAWPGERTLSSIEYQCQEAWKELLEEFAKLDPVTGALTFSDALAQLKRTAARRLFQPQEQDAPIQIMSHLEAGGLEFDYVWFGGLHEETWPPKPQLNPFLSIHAQKVAGIPEATSSSQSELARQILGRRCAVAEHITLSCARAYENTPVRPSAIMREFTLQIRECEDPRVGLGTLINSTALNFEESTENSAPPLKADVEKNIQGGSAILKNQSACPFRAFARHRLNATALDQPEPGLDALQRGSILHKALEQVWSELTSHKSLCEARDEQINELVYRQVQNALQKFQLKNQHKLPPNRFRLERTRLVRLILEWLSIERKRTPFEVQQVEQSGQLHIGGLTLDLRVDRVDRLADGGLLLIDYKSGKVSASDLGTDVDERRPREPQMLVYRRLLGDEVNGIAFAGLKRGDMRLAGKTCDDIFADGKPKPVSESDWRQQTKAWDLTVENLTEDFLQGVANIDPRNPGDDCRYCDLPSLCRIHSLMQVESEEPDE